MAFVQEFFKTISDYGSDLKQKNKDTSVVKLLDKTISTLDTALKAMDKFLKKKGIDVSKLAQDGKERSKSLLDKIKTNKAGEKVGLLKGLIEKGKDIKSSIKERYDKFNEQNTAPPEENADGFIEKTKNFFKKKDKGTDTEEEKKGFFSSMSEKLGLIADRLIPDSRQDLDGDGIKEEKWVEKTDIRAKKRKDEIEAEKKAVQDAGKKKGKGKGGFLSSILDKIGALGGLLSGAIWGATKFLGKGLARVAWWGATKLFSGLSGLFSRLIPTISGSIASALQSAAGKGLLGAGKLALRGALGLGRLALPFLGKAALAAGSALLSAPVLIGAAVVGAGVGAYFAYKYLTRNDIAEDIYGKLHLLRLQTYGFGHNAKEHYHKVFKLEELLKKNLTFNAQDKTLKITPPNEEQTKEIYEIFDAAEDKERQALVGNWFSKRFLPAYHAFIQVLYGINTSIYIDDLEKLSTNNIKQFTMLYGVPGSIYSYTQIPYFEQPETTVTKKDIETTLESIKFENNSKLKATDRPPAERMAVEIAKKKSEQLAQDATRKALKASGIKTKTTTKPNTEGPIGVMAMSPDTETPPTGAALLTATANKNQQIPKAEGPVVPFDGTLAGIRTKLRHEAITNLDPDVLNLFGGMAKEYNALTGKELTVTEAFRSYQEQAALYAKYGASGRAAPPGRSLHEFGLAIDVSSQDVAELERLGLLRKYGFTVPVGGEGWHLEPIGVSLDPDKSKHDKGFRKAAITSSVGRGGGGYGLEKSAAKYKRNIALQQSIYESKIAETKPESVVKEGVSLLTATTATNNGSAATPLVEATQAKAEEATTIPVNQVGGAVDMNKLMSGSIVAQEPEPTVKTSTAPVADIGSGYTNSIGTVNPNMNVSKYGKLTPVEAIKQASKMTGVPEDTLMTFGKLESSLRANVTAGTSSAGGLFQFTDPTWKEQLTKHGNKYGLSMDTSKTDPLANALMAAEYAKSNLSNVRGYEQAGLSQDVALYLTHHFGPTGGKKLIEAYKRNPNAPVTTAVSSSAYESNKAALGGKTISGYIASLEQKFTVAKNTPASEYKGSGATAVASTSPSTPSISNSSTMTPSYQENEATSLTVGYSPNPVPVAKPTLNQAAYDINKIEIPSSPVKTEQAPQVSVDTSSLELIMSNQLTTLTQIAAVLGTISDKLDMEKLMGVLSGLSAPQQKQSSPTPSMKQIPHTGVSMSKRIMT